MTTNPVRTGRSRRRVALEGPGEYLPEVTEGLTRVEDLPKPKIDQQSRNYKRRPCPSCGRSAYRDRAVTRVLHDRGDLKTNRPLDRRVSCSQHYGSPCDRYFPAYTDDLALPKAHYTHRVVTMAVRWVVEDGLP